MASNSGRSTGRIKLSELTDAELIEFMDSVETDEEADFDSDDDFDDPIYVPDEITPEDDQYVSEMMQGLEDSDIYITQAINMSLNISALDAPTASSTINPIEVEDVFVPVVTTEQNAVIEGDAVFVPVVEAEETVATTEPIPSTSSASKKSIKPAKRPRSPLPSHEATANFFSLKPTRLPQGTLHLLIKRIQTNGSLQHLSNQMRNGREIMVSIWSIPQHPLHLMRIIPKINWKIEYLNWNKLCVTAIHKLLIYGI
ncbi:uncharacterized protein LOC116340503 [Contarinia nasturtii]|uniref:uncharacterized protein LOC116340503 n=1 Tax=Contarinia nasturtii TaxID=265458 RepID=UPI0012D41159|nr:uncharacterized protein LOC116340503 [Contarinia nasturtii]